MGKDKTFAGYHKRLGPKAKQRAFAMLIRIPNLTRIFSDMLRAEDMPVEDQIYAVAWKVAVAYYEEYDEAINEQLFVDLLQDTLENEPELLDDYEYNELVKFQEFCFDPQLKLTEEWGTDALKSYVRTAVAENAARILYNNDAVVKNTSEFLEQTQDKFSTIESAGVARSTKLFEDGWDTEPVIQLHTTTMPFLDAFMGGGQAGGEVYGLMAPYGTCKTLMVLQMAVNQARICASNYYKRVNAGRTEPLYEFVVVAGYEEPKPQVRSRVISYGAEIPKSRLDKIKSRADYTSTKAGMKDYEKNLQAGKALLGKYGGTSPRVIPEWSRLQLLVPVINNHLLLLNAVDLEVSDGNTKLIHSTLGVGDLRAAIEAKRAELRAMGITNSRPRVLFIDYVNAAIQLAMEAREMSMDEMRNQIRAYPNRVRNKLAMPYNCPVWLMQQFNGSVQDSDPTTRLHHSQAAECRSFGENLVYNFTIGTKDENSRVVISMTKSRRSADHADIPLQIDGDMSRVFWLPNYVIDRDQKSIRPREQGEVDGIAETDDEFQNTSNEFPSLGSGPSDAH